jgi:hypothetical protein
MQLESTNYPRINLDMLDNLQLHSNNIRLDLDESRTKERT